MRHPVPGRPGQDGGRTKRRAAEHGKEKKKKKKRLVHKEKGRPGRRERRSATNNTEPVIAAHAMAVPRSGWKMIRPRKAAVGLMPGSNVSRLSSMDLVRHSRKHAKNRMRSDFAISEGWNEKLPQ